VGIEVRKTAFLQQKQNLKQSKQLRKHYLQTEKEKKKMLQAINQIPL
jgi:hypothetical protein